MKKYFLLLQVILLLSAETSCSMSDDEDVSSLGTIYGVIADKATGEPINSAGVELQPVGLKAVTGTDGQFEFTDIESGEYSLAVTKTGYKKVVSNTIIVDNGQAAKADVQMEKLPHSLRIIGADTKDISEISFTSAKDDETRSFVIFNDGPESINWEIVCTAGWLSISKVEDKLKAGGQYTVIVTIDRQLLNPGDNQTTIHVVSDNGSKDIKVNAVGSSVVNTLSPTEITQTSVVLCGQLLRMLDSIENVGIVYGTTPTPSLDGKCVELKCSEIKKGEFSFEVSGLNSGTNYYFRAFAVLADQVIDYSTILQFKTLTVDYIIFESANLMVQKSDLGFVNYESAVSMCANSTLGGYSDWRLPDKDELMVLYNNKSIIGGFKTYRDNLYDNTPYYWSTDSFTKNDIEYQYVIWFPTGESNGLTKGSKASVRAVRTIK